MVVRRTRVGGGGPVDDGGTGGRERPVGTARVPAFDVGQGRLRDRPVSRGEPNAVTEAAHHAVKGPALPRRGGGGMMGADVAGD